MPTPTAEVIAIGDEMTSGARLDTNTQWLCRRLNELGISVRFTSMVGDRLDDNIAVLRQASRRADFIVTSGGLGPTADDLTRDAIAAAFDLPLQLMPDALEHIESMFARSGRPMPPRNQVQAMFPQGATMIANRHGTAPGVDLMLPPPASGKRLLALPGVPAELFEMLDNVVTPRLIQQLGGGRRVLQHAVIKCFGIGESAMEARLGEMISRQHYPLVGITVSAATISLRIIAEAASELECQRMIAQTRAEIIDLAGEFVFGEGETFELPDAVAQLLAARGQCLAAVEIGAAAWVSSAMAAAQASDVWAGGISLPPQHPLAHAPADNRLRSFVADTLGSERPVDWILLVDRYPALPTAATDGARANVAASAADGAGLADGADGAAVRFALLPAATGRQTVQWERRFAGHPDILHARIGKTALELVRQQLIQPE